MVKPTKGKPSAKALAAAGVTPTDELQPIKVNLYEAGALKGGMDDVAREVIIDVGYEEDIMISNIKLGLGLSAMGFALYAQFGPGKFPANWWTVLGCVVAYLVLTFLMNWYSYRAEGDAFLVTRPFRGRKGLRVSSRMSRFAYDYMLILSDIEDPELEVHNTVKVTSYFDEDGLMASDLWRAEVQRLYEEYSTKAASGEYRTAKKKDE